LLLYRQHSAGIGHLVCSFNLARGLSKRFRVVLLNGGPLPDDQAVPAGVEMIQLPPLAIDGWHRPLSLDRAHSLELVRSLRLTRILETFENARPSVVLIERYPFGRKKFEGEVVPLLDAARRRASPPWIVSSVRDTFVDGRPDQQWHDDTAALILHEYFDAVLVHADPAFARLEESFRPRRPTGVRVHYTGFVVEGLPRVRAAARERRVLVSAGSGKNGLPLFLAVIEAHRALWTEHRLPMTIVAGPLFPEASWQKLQERAKSLGGLCLLRSVPDMRALMAGVTAYVGRCGYNSAMDILLSGVAALVVPFVESGNEEQVERARRMAKLSLVRTLASERLHCAALVDAIRGLIGFRPDAIRLDLNGAEATARIIAEMVRPCSRYGTHEAPNAHVPPAPANLDLSSIEG
jgi:predicted glycosyltransferase